MQIEVKHLCRDRDRHGNLRTYLRIDGRKVRIRAPEGTSQFLDECQSALLRLTTAPPAAEARVGAPPKRGTFHWLCMRYYASGEFKQLAASTQAVRRRILDGLSIEHGDKPFAELGPEHIRALRDAEAERPDVANARLKALRALFLWATETAKLAKRNPAAEVKRVTHRTDGFHSWSTDEVAQYETRHKPGSKARLALALLLYSGARRGDVVLLGRQMIRDGWLTFTPLKTAKITGKVVSIPVVAALRVELDLAPTGHLTYLVTEYGKPFSAPGFGNKFREWCNEAGLPHCSAHGLRKAGAAILAEKGATEPQLNAIYGWAEGSNESRTYTRKARQKVLAAAGMHLLEDESGNKTIPLFEDGAESGTISGEKANLING